MSVFLGILMGSGLFAQVDKDWKHELAEQLESDHSVEYLQLVGYFNDYFFAQMRFAFDEDHWTGFISFPDDNIQFELDGGYVNDELVLVEYDKEGQQSGYWKIKRDHEKYICSWQSNSGKMTHEIVMVDELWNPGLEKTYSQEIRSYTGNFGNMLLEIFIHRNVADSTFVSVFDPTSRTMVGIKYKCLNNSCNSVSLDFDNMKDKSFEYHLNIQRDKLDLIGKKEGKEVSRYSFVLMDHVQTGLETVMENAYFMAIEFPELSDPGAAHVVKKELMEMRKQLKLQLETLTESQMDMDERLEFFAISWFDIYYWNDQIISGKWNIQKSWNTDVESRVINYSIRNKREIDLFSQFNSDFDFEFFLSHFIENEKREMPEFIDPLSRGKIQNASFELINLTREGILLGSPFDTIFGQFEMLIRYDEIEQHLRKRSDLKKLLEKNTE